METTYPQFYRKDGKCAKVLNATQARVIILPPESSVPERITTTFPNVDRMNTFLKSFEECSEDLYRQFSETFYMSLEDEICKFRQNQFEKIKKIHESENV